MSQNLQVLILKYSQTKQINFFLLFYNHSTVSIFESNCLISMEFSPKYSLKKYSNRKYQKSKNHSPPLFFFHFSFFLFFFFFLLQTHLLDHICILYLQITRFLSIFISPKTQLKAHILCMSMNLACLISIAKII